MSYLPGDIFGFEAGETHISSAEAICETQLLMVKRIAIIVRASHERELTQQLLDVMALELHRLQEHMMLLISSAEDRVVAFLLDMFRRATKNAAIELPMSRQDVADYLGLTIKRCRAPLPNLSRMAWSPCRPHAESSCVTTDCPGALCNTRLS
ncbi:helix-turn-helix domain-containing protein [Bradyrhizobium zhanjiangense]|uniref:helix-turn-helix domain-containing protein n=1 Tax=Bradyrhizobium zhanjiangense TaxID=1325107 RepID=UPI001FE000B1|nr:helix-turn-helix domain-containing protein [Bradyrhizobium zhanjiangense]